MSDKQAGQAYQRKSSTNKNIKKLRTISMVCSLTSSWQQWVTENEKKQASEPSGWAPSSLGGLTEEPKKTCFPTKNPSAHTQPTDASENHIISSGDSQKSLTPHEEIRGASKTEVNTLAEPQVGSPIKVKQVVTTVTSGVQEKGAGIGLLTEKIKRQSLPSGEEIDRILKKKSSPTRRRKCSNMVSSLTKSWKQVENEQKPGKEEGGLGEGCTRVGDEDDGGHPETERLDAEEKETVEKDSEGDSESAVKIKRPTVPV